MGTDTITIRKMRREDVESAMELLGKWNMAPIKPSQNCPEPERSTINVENTFVALEGKELVGVASYILHSNTCAETASLAVDPSCRGKGIGARLQEARLSEMKKRGIKKVRTETDRPETIRWYKQKFGYKEVGRVRKKHPFSLPEVDYWTVLELEL